MELRARNVTIIFIFTQMILYVAFLALDLTDTNVTLSGYIKYSMIILCFCYALFFGKSDSKSILFCMKMALFFTLVSDLFIIILDYYYYGVLTFIFAQQLYGIRIGMEKYDVRNEQEQSLLRRNFLVILACQAIVMTLICLILRTNGTKLDELLIASVFYFISITTNVIRGIHAAVRKPRNRELLMFTVGIILFLLCDINVGLFNLTGYISLPNQVYSVLYGVASILMWTFYAPSQVLLALSTRQKKLAE